AASQRRRTQEAVILRTLGASRGQILLAWLAEFGALGLTAGIMAAAVGAAASYGVLHFFLHGGWIFLPGALAATLVGAVAVMLVFGYISIAVALAAKPGPLLRNE
ncbi:MAG: ABC transporter permease, partial [Acetobacteraceae bacterium]|nr:ABC transporter permease [Acetobacteraceae bacterium]